MFGRSVLLAGIIFLSTAAWFARPGLAADLYAGTGAVGDCTGVAISATVVLSAAHCFAGVNPATVSFQGITASRIDIAPGYVSFGQPDFDNDLAAIVLSASLDQAVPTYELFLRPLVLDTPITFVHRDGTTGNNVVDLQGIEGQTTFLFDYDDPQGQINVSGGTAVSGEATFRSGDSGGPSFVLVNGVPKLLGIDTFIASTSAGSEGEYGSLGGGILVSYYQDFLGNYVPVPEPTSPLAVLLAGGCFGWLKQRALCKRFRELQILRDQPTMDSPR